MSTPMVSSRRPVVPTRMARFEMVSGGARAIQWMRLFELELRRGPGFIGALAIAIATLWMMWQELPNGVVYWDTINRSAGMAMGPVAAVAGGVSAWAASRDHRRQTFEQVDTTSFPRCAQQAMSALAVTLWSITGYLAVAMSFYGYASTKATWAGPQWDFPLIVVGAIVGAVGFGWLIGTVWPRTMAPVLIVAVIWGGDLLWEVTNGLRDIIGHGSTGFEVSPDQMNLANPPQPPSGLETFLQNNGAWRFLIPSEYIKEQIVATNVTGWAVLWMAGLGAVFFLVARWSQRRAVMPLVRVFIALIIALAGGLGAAAKYDFNWGMRAEQHPPQTCTTRLDGALTVCLHERQKALLPETADIVAELLSPIAGRTWVPMRWESGSSEARGDLAEGIGLVNFYDRDEIENLEVQQRILRNLLTYPGDAYFGITGGDYVVLTWLLEEAGISREDAVSNNVLPELPVLETRRVTGPRDAPAADPVPLDAAEVDASIERFLALSSEERETWLDANWSDVFTGTLTLEDLP